MFGICDGAFGATKAAPGSAGWITRPKAMRSSPFDPYPCSNMTRASGAPSESGERRGPSSNASILLEDGCAVPQAVHALVAGAGSVQRTCELIVEGRTPASLIVSSRLMVRLEPGLTNRAA